MTQNQIQWRRLGGIVAVQSSITLAWVIYSLYLPDLLVQLGFAKQLAGVLLIIEHALETLIEPIFGDLSDRSQRQTGTRFPWITLGIGLASACFILLPAIALFASPSSPWRWFFPLTAVLWASAMAIFRSPVMALLRQAAPQPQLPIAVSCLTLVQQLVSALRFTAYGVILSFGPGFTFAIGSFVLLGAATVLRQVTPPTPPQPVTKPLPPMSIRTVGVIVGTAVGIGWGLRFIFAVMAQVSAAQLGEAQGGWGLLGFSVLLALSALPAGRLASQLGNARVMLGGLVMTAGVLAAIPSVASGLMLSIAVIVMGFAFSAVLNGMVPLVLAVVPGERTGLGLGAYFGAFGGAISFFGLFFARFSGLGLQAGLGALALILASCFVVIGQQYRVNPR